MEEEETGIGEIKKIERQKHFRRKILIEINVDSILKQETSTFKPTTVVIELHEAVVQKSSPFSVEY